MQLLLTRKCPTMRKQAYDFVSSILDLAGSTTQETALDALSFTEVMFKVDFGPWKLGKKYHNIEFDFERGTIKEWDINQNLVHGRHIHLVCGRAVTR